MNFARRYVETFAVVAALCAVGGTAACASAVRGAGATTPAFRSVYDGGIELYERGSFSEAAAVFEQAYLLDARPEPLYMLARCRHRLGYYADAAAKYDGFLDAAPAHRAAEAARLHRREALDAEIDSATWVPPLRD